MPTYTFHSPRQTTTVTTRGGPDLMALLTVIAYALIAYVAAAIVQQYFWWIIGISAVVLAVAVTGAVYLLRFLNRLEDRRWANARLWMAQRAPLMNRQVRQIPAPARQAIAPPTDADALAAALLIVRAHTAHAARPVVPARVIPAALPQKEQSR